MAETAEGSLAASLEAAGDSVPSPTSTTWRNSDLLYPDPGDDVAVRQLL